MTTATAYPHVELDESGMPYVRGTRFKVVQIVLDRLAYHWDADEIRRQHPQLTLGQIHGALAYYYDHQDEMHDLIERREQQAREVLASIPASPFRIKLQTLKRITAVPHVAGTAVPHLLPAD